MYTVGFISLYGFKDNYFLLTDLSKRLNYVNHARRLADGDWTGTASDGEEDMEKQEQGGSAEEEGMEVESRKLPKNYANQVSACMFVFFFNV